MADDPLRTAGCQVMRCQKTSESEKVLGRDISHAFANCPLRGLAAQTAVAFWVIAVVRMCMI